MTSVVLVYRGIPSQRKTAEARLRSHLPGIVLTPKASTLLEAQVDDSQAVMLEQDPDWAVSRPTFAEIRKPAINLKNMRAKLSGNR